MDPRAGGWRAIGPEWMAIVAGVLAWVVLGTVLLVGGGQGAGAVTPSPSPSPTEPTDTARPDATIDGGLIVLIRSSHARLFDQRDSLQTLLAAERIDTGDVKTSVRQISSAVTFAAEVSDRIASQPGGASIDAALQAAYAPILDGSKDVLSLALSNDAGIRTGAEALVEAIAGLPDVDALVADATPSRSPSATPDSSATPTATPSQTPAVTIRPTPEPTGSDDPTATPAATGPNQLVNPGFEAGSAPWRLVLGPGASGAFDVVSDEVHSGEGAALIAQSSSPGAWSDIALRQDGIRLENGTTVRVQLWARSTAARNIRVRITTGLGEIVASRILPIDTSWSLVSFDLTAIGTITDAVLTIEAGLSGQPVWIDDLSVG